MATHVKESNGCKFTHRIQLSNWYPLLVFSMFLVSYLFMSYLSMSCLLKWIQICTNRCKSCLIQFNDCNAYENQMIGTGKNHGWDFFCKIPNVYPFQCWVPLVFLASWVFVSLESCLPKWIHIYSHGCKSCWIQFNDCNTYGNQVIGTGKNHGISFVKYKMLTLLSVRFLWHFWRLGFLFLQSFVS